MLLNPGKTGLWVLSSSLMALSLGTYADNLDITFTANIRDTTCDMKIEGGSGDGSSNVIPIGTDGKVRLDYIILKMPKQQQILNSKWSHALRV